MPSPLCLVADGLGPFNPTLNGLNINPGDTVSVQLAVPGGVTNWYLQIGLILGNPPVVIPGTGTDEVTSPAPPLTGVNGAGLVLGGPTATVTFVFPNAQGRTLLFSSTVTGGFGAITTTFALFSITSAGYRVGATGMSREGSNNNGWTSIVNPAIRQIGGGGGVATVTGSPPIASSGGVNPNISYTLAGQTQGDFSYFNGSNWVRLPAGTSGQFLETLGNAANPQWATVVTTVGANSPISSSGGSTPTISFAFIGQTQGDVTYFNGTNWVRLPAGTSGQFLETQGNAANPQWATAVTSVGASSPIASSGGATPTITYSIGGQTQGDFAYFDGSNWVRLPAGTSGQFLETLGNAANPQWATAVTSVTAGSSPISVTAGSTPAVSFAIASQAQGDVVYFNGTNWVRLPAGSSGQFLETLGAGANPQWAAAGGGGSGFTDNAVAKRTHQRRWMRKNEFTNSGDTGGSNKIDPSTFSSSAIPQLLDNGTQLAGTSVTTANDHLFFTGLDNASGIPGALYGIDLYALIGTGLNPVNNASLTAHNGPPGQTTPAIPILSTANLGGLIEVTTNNPHNLNSGTFVTIFGVVGTTEANGVWVIQVIDANNFTLTGSAFTHAYVSGGTITYSTPILVYSSGFAITNATNNAGLIQITAAGNTFSNGDTVIIAGVNGVPANGSWVITNVVAGTSFTLNGSTFSGAFVATAGGGYIPASAAYLSPGDGPNELIAARSSIFANFGPIEWLWAGGNAFVELDRVQPTSNFGSSQVFIFKTQSYRTTISSAVIRACFLKGGQSLGAAGPIFAYTAVDGNVYIVDTTGTVHTALSPAAGSNPQAILCDDAGYVWIAYTQTSPTVAQQIVKCSVNYGANTLTVVNTITLTAFTATAQSIVDLVSDGRQIWALGQTAGAATLFGFDLTSATAGPIYTLVTQGTGTPSVQTFNRLGYDGENLYLNLNNNGIYYVEPQTGEVLFFTNTSPTAFYRSITIDSSSTMLGAIFPVSGAPLPHHLEFMLAATGYPDANFQSIRNLYRPLNFASGGRQNGQLLVNNAAGNVALTGQAQTAFVDTVSGTTDVTTPPGNPNASTPGTEWDVTVMDIGGSANTSPITIHANGGSIEDPNKSGSFSSTVQINVPYMSCTWRWMALLGGSELVSPVWKLISVVRNGIVHKLNDIPLATIQGATSGTPFTMFPFLPPNAQLLGGEINVIQTITGGTISAVTATVQTTAETAGAILASTDVFTATGFFNKVGNNPYQSRGGTAMQITLTSTGGALSTATTGHLAVSLFYIVLP